MYAQFIQFTWPQIELL